MADKKASSQYAEQLESLKSFLKHRSEADSTATKELYLDLSVKTHYPYQERSIFPLVFHRNLPRLGFLTAENGKVMMNEFGKLLQDVLQGASKKKYSGCFSSTTRLRDSDFGRDVNGYLEVHPVVYYLILEEEKVRLEGVAGAICAESWHTNFENFVKHQRK